MYDDYMLRYIFLTQSARSMSVLKNVASKPLREELEELRKEDPDGYANLTEHLLLPEGLDG